MEDHNKTKAELIHELQQLRAQSTTFEPQTNASPQQIEQLTALMKTAESLLSIHDLPTLWPRVETAVKNMLQADRMAIYKYDAAIDRLTCSYTYGLSQNYIDQTNESFYNVSGSSQLFKLAPVWTQDAQTDPAFSHLQEAIVAEGFHTVAVFPLISSRGRLNGGLGLFWDEERPLSAAQLHAGHTLAHMISLAINTITLFDETERNLLREKQLSEISRMLNVTRDLPNLLGNVVKMVAELIHADGGLLGLVIDRDIMTFYPYNVPHWMSLRPAPRPRGLAWQIVNNCQPILLKDYPSHPEAMSKWIEAGVTHFVGVPLRAQDICLGMLALFNLDKSPHHFDKRDLDLAISVGQQAGIAIQNLRQLSETQQRAAAMAAALNRQAELDMMKNNFTQSVSHELRSPLGIIYGHAELLASGSLGELNEDQKQSSSIIMRRVLMLTDLVDDLTALLAAETQELRREEIDTTVLVQSLLADYEIRAQSMEITLEAIIQEPVPWILGDSTHLRRVFDNLLANALKFTQPGGSITLRLKAKGEEVHIEVEDDGEGIPEDKLGRIFERFYQVESGSARRHKGTGLGLTLVKEIVEAHRGTISVRSTLGQGTTFIMHIPGYFPSQD